MTTAPAVLCTGAALLAVALLEALATTDDDTNALDDTLTLEDDAADELADIVALRETELVTIPDRDAELVIEAAAELTRELRKVGVTVTEGTASLNVGITSEDAPKKGALPGSNIGPVSVVLLVWDEGPKRVLIV